MSDEYRRDGTPYPEGDAGLFEWVKDFQCKGYTILDQTVSPYGELISTVWLGSDHSFGGGRPLIFETMVFGLRGKDRLQLRYSTEAEAWDGHWSVVTQSFVPPPLRRRLFDGWY